MKSVASATNEQDSDSGFTLVETLIALMVLAISAGLIVQSVALATGQVRTSAQAASAERLAVSLLAELDAGSSGSEIAEGIDLESGLHWKLVRERRTRVVDEIERGGSAIIVIQVRAAKNHPVIFESRKIAMQAETL